MISKMINVNYKKNKYVNSNLLNNNYLNYVNDSTVITPYSSQFLLDETYDLLADSGGEDIVLTFDIDKTNLLNFSIVNEIELTPELVNNTAGIKVDLFPSGISDGRLTTIDTIALQFNKLNKEKMDRLGQAELIIEAKKKSDNSNLFKVVFKNHGLSADYYSSGAYYTKKWLPEEGIVLLDKEILSYFVENSLMASTNIDITQYYFNIYFKGLTTYDDVFFISNLAITNCYAVYFNENLDFTRDNLSRFNTASKTGLYLPEINEYSKAFNTEMNLLTANELNFVDINFIKNNQNNPMFIFPYCESSTQANRSSNYIYNYRNLEHGGLYIVNDNFKIKNEEFDDFEISIAAKEWK
jgi:hypothetical protein